MSTLFLTLAIFSAWATYNLYFPVFTHKQGALLSFFSGLIIGELALHHIFLQVLITLGFVSIGAVDGNLGVISLLILFASWIALALYYLQAHEAQQSFETALQANLGANYKMHIRPRFAESLSDSIRHKRLLLPSTAMRSSHVECLKNIIYHQVNGMRLKLDIRMAREHRATPYQTPAPVLLQIHGGAWTYRMGSKNEQALPLMNHLAELGWICVSIDYRLSPKATFPEHIIDCKRALVWVKQHIAEYGGDPNFIVVTGGSAGGHLSALLALTPNLAAFQPGFEDADTHVQGCVSFYGIYDFLDTHQLQLNNGLHNILENSILKESKTANPALYQLASPIHHIYEQAPPFMIIQGDKDTLVAVSESRVFAEHLQQISEQPVVYVELAGAQHAFDMLPSLRTEHTINGIERFCAWLYSQHLEATEG